LQRGQSGRRIEARSRRANGWYAFEVAWSESEAEGGENRETRSKHRDHLDYREAHLYHCTVKTVQYCTRGKGAMCHDRDIQAHGKMVEPY